MEELGGFEEGVGKVVNDEDKSTASGELRCCQNQFKLNYSWYPPGEVAGPGEAEEGDGGEVVDEHLPKVFALHIKKLQDRQGPVESQLKHTFHRPSHFSNNIHWGLVSVNLKHVVPPDEWLHRMVWILLPETIIFNF